MAIKESPLCDIMIIPQIGDRVKSLEQTLSEMARHKTLAQDIQRILGEYYLEQGKYEKAHWIPQCGNWLKFRQYDNQEQTTKLMAANYCHHQLCPMCAWRRHIKNGAILSAALDGMESLYMVTLTVDNTPKIERERLREVIKQSTAMLRSMGCSDYVANLEITYSEEKGFHPHVHAIVYQPAWDRAQIAQNMAYWRKKWGQRMGGEHGYNILHIAPIEKLGGAVAEVTKYLCKPMTPQDDIVVAIKELIPAIRRVRQIRAGGEIRKRMAKVKLGMLCLAAKEENELGLNDCTYTEIISAWINGEYHTEYLLSREGGRFAPANTTRP